MIDQELFQRVIDEYFVKVTPEQYFQDVERINSEPDFYDASEIQSKVEIPLKDYKVSLIRDSLIRRQTSLWTKLKDELKLVLSLTAEEINFTLASMPQFLQPTLQEEPMLEEFKINLDLGNDLPVWLVNRQVIIKLARTTKKINYSCRIDPPPSDDEIVKYQLVVVIRDDIGREGEVKLTVRDSNRKFKVQEPLSANLVALAIYIGEYD